MSQLLTKDNMVALMKEAREDAGNQILLLMAMEEITKKRPDKITPHLNELMNLSLWQPLSLSFINRILQFYALKLEGNNEVLARTKFSIASCFLVLRNIQDLQLMLQFYQLSVHSSKL